MIIREAAPEDAQALKVLYFDYLTKYPPTEEQDMDTWQGILAEYNRDPYNYILVIEVYGYMQPDKTEPSIV